MRKILFVALALFSVAPVTANDHLLPEESIFAGTFGKEGLSYLAQRLGRMHDTHTFANAVVLPSFSKDYVVSFEKRADNYLLVCMQTKISMGAYRQLEWLKNGTFQYSTEEETQKAISELEARLPANFMDVEAEVIEIELAPVLGRKLYSAWGQVLYDTRYPAPGEITPETHANFGPGYDGTYFHFSFFHNYTPLSGWIWDYPPGGRVAKLVTVVTSAKAACEANNHGAMQEFTKSVDMLVEALAN